MKPVEDIKKVVEEDRKRKEEIAIRVSNFLKENSSWAYTVEELYDKFPAVFEYTPLGRLTTKVSMIGILERYGVRIVMINGWEYLYYGGVNDG